MNVINDTDRFIFEKYLNKYLYKDIAKETNCKESTIKSIIQQKRKITNRNRHIYEALKKHSINQMEVEIQEIKRIKKQGF